LISLAVDDGLRAAVQRELDPQRVTLLDVVVDELKILADGDTDVAGLASDALGQLDWLGNVAPTSGYLDLFAVREIQNTIRGTRALKHDLEHWAESVIMHIAPRLQVAAAHMLSEDHAARVESQNHRIKPFSVHKLLARMVQGARLDADDAVAFADALKAAGRGPDVTAEEFRTGRLRRVGQP
jgi:hypothetical protein